MAGIRNVRFGRITQGTGDMIRIDEIWLATQPMDMRAGIDTAMAQIMKTFGSISKPISRRSSRPIDVKTVTAIN